MKFFTFCVDIKRHNQDTLTRVLKMMVHSLDYHVKQYQMIVYTNFTIKFPSQNVTYRDYYDKTVDKMYNDNWLNLSYNKINIYKDLHDEFLEDFIWIDLDTVITANISYVNSMSHFFIENGGSCCNKNILFTNNNTFTVPRKHYIQGNVWKLNIDLYRQLMDVLATIQKKNLVLQYDLQDLFNYYIYIHKQGQLDGFNILGNTCYPHTLNGLALWDITGTTHATMNGLQHLYLDNNHLRSKYYPNKEIHLVSFTFNTLKELYDTNEFKTIFPYILEKRKKIGVFGTCRIDDYNFEDFKQLSTQYPYIYQNDQFTINVRPLGYTTTTGDVLQNLSLIKTGEHTKIIDRFVYKNVLLKHGGIKILTDLDYDYLVIEVCSIKKIIHKKSGLIFPYEIEGQYQDSDYDFVSETFDETINNIRQIKMLVNCPIILLPPIITFDGIPIKGDHENTGVSRVINYRSDIVRRINECVKQINDIHIFEWNNEIKQYGILKMLRDQFHFTEFGKKNMSSKILDLIRLPSHKQCFYYIENVKINIPYENHTLHRYYQMFPFRNGCEWLFRQLIKSLINDQLIDHQKNIIDLGAWIGDNTIPWSMLIKGVVYAIDPSPENVNYIQTLVSLNHLDNVHVIEAIVSNLEEFAYTNQDLKHAEFNEKSGKHKLMSTTLDQLLHKNRVTDVSYIHLSVEGYEFKVLNGGRELIEKYHPIISWKAHIDMSHYQHILGLMSQLNYVSFLLNERFPHCRQTCRNFISFPKNAIPDSKIATINQSFGQLHSNIFVDKQKPFLIPMRTN
jgi:FkbM family methyltransferase